MNPSLSESSGITFGIPRVSGDEPLKEMDTSDLIEYSPRERG